MTTFVHYHTCINTDITDIGMFLLPNIGIGPKNPGWAPTDDTIIRGVNLHWPQDLIHLSTIQMQNNS